MASRLCNLGLLTAEQGQFDKARGYLLEARQHYERKNNLYGKAATLCNLGDPLTIWGMAGIGTLFASGG